MIYPNLTFPKKTNRPFFYTNFVATLDGKVTVTNQNAKAYWPIGSSVDHDLLIELRAQADLLIHGKNTAVSFKTIKSLSDQKFKQLRRKFGKDEIMPYMIISNHPSDIASEFLDYPQAEIKSGNNLKKLAADLNKRGFKNILIEGGPNLLGQFLKEELVDEIFLTIAPKIFGNQKDQTLTMVEGVLFPPEKVKNLKLLSVKQVKDELFLRYKIQDPR